MLYVVDGGKHSTGYSRSGASCTIRLPTIEKTMNQWKLQKVRMYQHWHIICISLECVIQHIYKINVICIRKCALAQVTFVTISTKVWERLGIATCAM